MTEDDEAEEIERCQKTLNSIITGIRQSNTRQQAQSAAATQTDSTATSPSLHGNGNYYHRLTLIDSSTHTVQPHTLQLLYTAEYFDADVIFSVH